VGSAATVLGNPIGILIASKSGLTFEDFIIKALPLSFACLIATIFICILWYRKSIDQMDEGIRKHNELRVHVMQHPVVFTKDLKISLVIFGLTLAFISLHHRLELLWKLAPNTILLIMPLFSSGLVMIWKWRKARDYIERDVEWWTLLFFMFLFAQAGTLQYTGATDELARRLAAVAGNSWIFLTGLILWISAIGSSILDNVVLVAALIPVIQSFKAMNITLQPLWWALLFGGCLGGNITLVGSTANIIALGILEKEKKVRMTFMRWFGIGLTVGIVTTCIVWAALLLFPIYR
jgi:Na+/H+ antiporter NhaD/arsenite permease-like protein